MTTLDKVVAGAGLVVMLVLHVDFWRPQSATLYAGWIPAEIAYRLVGFLLAWLYLLFFCARIWREEDE